MTYSIPTNFSWPAMNTVGICSLQTLAGAGAMTIDGSLSYWPRPDVSYKYASFGNVVRVVSLTSVNNLSGVNFTVSGYFNGLPVSETLSGPNANTVETTQIFETVTSITTNAAAAAVSAGSGSTGQTKYIQTPPGQFDILTVVTNGTGGITFEGRWTALDSSQVSNFNNPSYYQSFTSGSVTNTINEFSNPLAYMWYVITVSTGTASLDIRFSGSNLYGNDI